MGVRVPPSPPAGRARAERGTSRWLEDGAQLAAAGALALLVIVSWLCLAYARPQADDYAVAVHGRELGPAGYANEIYLTKSGRWTGHALLALVLSRIDLTRSYSLALFALALLNLGASYAFARALLAESVPARKLFFWALAFEALLWAGRPVPGQTLYWFSGAVPYQLSLTCSVYLVAGLIGCARRGRAGAFWKAAAVLLPVFVAGLQELVAMMLVAVLVAGAWFARRLRLSTRKLWWWSIAAALVGLAASLAAPGNAARSQDFPQGGDVWLTLRTFSWDCLRAWRDWILEPPLLLASLFLWLSPTFRGLSPRWLQHRLPWTPVVALAGAAGVSMGLAGPRWATGTWQPPRMLASDYVLFFHAWFVLLFLVTRHGRFLPRSELVSRLGRVAALLGLCVALVLSGNGRRALGDLAHGRIQGWSAALGERYELLRAAERKGTLDLTLPSAPAPPRIYASMDVGDDPSHWNNAAVARWFGLRSVTRPKHTPSESLGED